MATDSVSNFSAFINNQIKEQEKLEFLLWHVETLITTIKITDRLSEKLLDNYLLVIANLIEQAKEANQTSLDQLLKIKIP